MSGFVPGEWEWILEYSDCDKDDGFFISNNQNQLCTAVRQQKKQIKH